MLILFLFTLVSAGCLNNNSTSNARSFQIVSQGNGINITTNGVNLQPLLTFTLASITEMTPTEEPIPEHSVCFTCATNPNMSTFENFSSCIDTSKFTFSNAKKEKANFSVEIGNWVWCDDCVVGETNDTVKGNYLDVVFLLKTATVNNNDNNNGGKKDKNGKSTRDVSFGQYKMKFINQFSAGNTSLMMNSGYPLIVRSESGIYVTARFQRLESLGNFVYQPQISATPAPAAQSDTPQNTASRATSMAIGAACSLMGIVGLFYYWKTKRGGYDKIPENIVTEAEPSPNAPFRSMEESQSGLEMEQVEHEYDETPDPYARPDPTFVSAIKPVRLQQF